MISLLVMTLLVGMNPVEANTNKRSCNSKKECWAQNRRGVNRPARPSRPGYRPHRPSRPTRPHRPVTQRPRPNRRPSVIHGPGHYRRYNHVPYRNRYRHQRRYYNIYDYHRGIPYRHVYANNWLRFYVGYNYGNGYVMIGGYPYFVYNGYRHRYSYYDHCNYELVDTMYNSVVTSYYGRSCADSYNSCAAQRDQWNWNARGYRYFCSERYMY